MNRFHPATSALLAAAFLGMFCSIADAQDIYKWIDADGKTLQSAEQSMRVD